MVRRLILAIAVSATCLGLPACKRKPLQPSPQYEKASRIHQDLYVRKLDAAYLDPRMDEAVALLKQVPGESVDSAAAQELLQTIEKGRAQAKAESAEREKAQAELRKGLEALSAVDPSKVLNAAAPVAGAADAGTPAEPDPYGEGASLADINRQSGGCLVAGIPFTEEGSTKRGVTYKVASSPECRAKLPGMVDELVLVIDGRVYRRVPADSVRQVDVPVPAEEKKEATKEAAKAAPKAAAPAPAPKPAEPPANPDYLRPPPVETTRGDVDPQVRQ